MNAADIKPDFAYPATVSKTAESDLEKAVKSHDAHAAFNALVRYWMGQTLIDPASDGATIKKAEEVADAFSNDKLHGLFLSLIARMYYEAYSADSWKYDQRELPLTPLPDNITEWSGKQFKAKISGLAIESVSGKNAEGLATLPITDYSDLIICEPEAAVYFPTLLDFAFLNGYQLACYFRNDQDKSQMLDKALERVTTGSAPYVYWMTERAASSDNRLPALMNLLRRMDDNEYAGYIFTQITFRRYEEYPVEEEVEDGSTGIAPGDRTDREMQYKRNLYDMAVKYLKSFPATPFNTNINDLIGDLSEPIVEVFTPQMCGVGSPLNVTVNNKNTKSLTLDIYKLKDSEVGNRVKAATLAATRKPVISRVMNFEGTAPFKTDSIITVTLTEPGYYTIVPVIPGGEKDSNIYNTIRCIPAYPVSVSNATHPMVAVVNPVTGAPMQGVGVSVISRQKATSKGGTTDRDGLATIKGKADGDLMLTYNGHQYKFSDVSVQDLSLRPDTAANYNASVVTDRAIYHPGEKLQVLAILAQSYSRIAKPALHNACGNRRITITLFDTNFQEVASTEGMTDDFGRLKTEFDLPATGLTGAYSVCVSFPDTKSSRRRGRYSYDFIGSQSVMVSDFKLPDFEVTGAVATNDTPAKGDVTVTAKAVTYSGVAVANAKAQIFLYGKTRVWWERNTFKLFTVDATTDAEGNLSAMIPESVFAKNKQYSFFEASIEVESATGAKASTNVVFSTGRKYLISVDCNYQVDGTKPFAPKIEVRASDGSKVNVPLTWKLNDLHGKQVAGGDYTGDIDLSQITPGDYFFVVATADSVLAEPDKHQICIYNTKTDIVPAARLWVQETNCVTDNGRYEILYGTPCDDTWVYCIISDGKGNISDVTLVNRKKGYHHIPVTVPEGEQRVYVNLFTVHDLTTHSWQIIVDRRRPDTSLKIVGETFRDKLIPGSEETWKIRITGADGKPQQSALMLDMYNKALDTFGSHDASVIAYGSDIFAPLYIGFSYCGTSQFSASVPFNSKGHAFILPKFNFYGHDDFATLSRPVVLYSMAGRVSPMMKSARPMGAANSEAAADYEMADEASAEVADTGAAESPEEAPAEEQPSDNFDYRANYVPLAVWAPMLTTDADGNITYTFTVPNANTTWRLLALAWTKDFRLGRMVREFVAAKPLMVTPNLPRFLRNGDHASVRASVMNNSDKAVTAVTVVELFNPVTGEILESKEFRNEIAPGMTETVTSDITADYNIAAIGYRVRTTNGEFSDGEQSVVRVLPADASLIETRPFYLNPGETEYTTELPKDKGARISLTFMENPSWTILTALPGLRTQIDEYANSAAAALYSAGIARGLIKDNPRLADALRTWSENPGDSTLVSMLEKNEDLKIALLNATPWVQAAQSDTERMANLALLLDDSQVSASVNKAFGILKDLQQSDGGWKWAKWCDESSVFVTSNVLGMMADLKTLGWMPQVDGIDSMLKKALNFYDSKVDDTDLLYTILRPQFADVPVSNNGKAVIDRTIRKISTDWKKYDDVAYKAMAAEALYRNKEQMLAAELMRSISEFGVMTKDQGLKFPSVNALYNYAILLDAYALIKPGSPEAEGLRQQLIIRKQGSDWGSAVVTTQVVQSLLASSGKWLVDARGAEVSVGSHTIQPTSEIEKLTGWMRTGLSEYAGKKLKIETTGTGPSYGAVYAQFSRNMADVKASGCDALDIEKKTYVRRGLDWEEAQTLKVGDRVRVQLTIHCKRNLNYVSIVDERPACYQPVDQIPGWLWSEGAAFYRENRDSSTQLHIVYLRPGTYLLTYEMDVNNAGDFSSGVATIQSQYAPEISAHSSGRRISVTE